jgi:hypothetical protein
VLKDELLGLAEDPSSDPVFKNHALNMDVLYRSGETQQVEIYDFEVQFKKIFCNRYYLELK